MHKLREPTQKQIDLAESLGIESAGKSFRVLSAEIADALEVKSFKTVEDNDIGPGVRVEYSGPRDDMPLSLVVSTIAKNGYLYFKRTRVVDIKE